MGSAVGLTLGTAGVWPDRFPTDIMMSRHAAKSKSFVEHSGYRIGFDLIPLAKADFDAGTSAKPFLKRGCVHRRAALITIMVRVNNCRLDCADAVSGIAHSHGEGHIHAQERNVDIRESADFGLIAGVAADVNVFAANGKHVTIAAALW